MYNKLKKYLSLEILCYDNFISNNNEIKINTIDKLTIYSIIFKILLQNIFKYSVCNKVEK